MWQVTEKSGKKKPKILRKKSIKLCPEKIWLDSPLDDMMQIHDGVGIIWPDSTLVALENAHQTSKNLDTRLQKILAHRRNSDLIIYLVMVKNIWRSIHRLEIHLTPPPDSKSIYQDPENLAKDKKSEQGKTGIDSENFLEG